MSDKIEVLTKRHSGHHWPSHSGSHQMLRSDASLANLIRCSEESTARLRTTLHPESHLESWPWHCSIFRRLPESVWCSASGHTESRMLDLRGLRLKSDEYNILRWISYCVIYKGIASTSEVQFHKDMFLILSKIFDLLCAVSRGVYSPVFYLENWTIYGQWHE